MTGVYASLIGLGLVVLLLALLCVAMLQSHAEILRRLDRLGVRLDDEQRGAPLVTSTITRRQTTGDIPDLVGISPDGEVVSISPTAGTDPVLIAFLSTTCSSCTMFWEGLDRPYHTVDRAAYRVVVVTLGASEESPTRAQSLARPGVDVVMSSEAWQAFEVPGAPYFALVDPAARQVIGEGSASSMDALNTFLSDSAGDRSWDTQQQYRDRTGAERETRIDEELRRAGIVPNDPRLYPSRPEELN